MRKKLSLALSLLLLLTLLGMAATAMAATQDGAGNLFADSNVAGQSVPSDLYATGETLSVSGCDIGGSAILAGQTIRVDNTSVDGSIRAAGYSVTLSGSQAAKNATLAGYNVVTGADFAARGVYAAAATVHFDGACDTLCAAAQSVTLAGSVNGDAHIYAEQVVISENAVVTGTLYVDAAAKPAIPASAKVGSLVFTPNDTADDAAAAATAAAVAKPFAKLKSLILYLPGRMLLAVLFYFAIGGSLRRAAGMITARPVAMPVSGLIALISLPMAALLLLLTYIGIPAGVLLLCLYTLTLCFAVSFAGCIAGMRVLPKLHPLVASLIGVAALTLLKLIPYLGGLLTFAAMVYTLGYFVQDVYLRNKRPAPAAPTPDIPSPSPAQAPESLAEPTGGDQ